MVFVLRWESGKQKEIFTGISSLRHLLARIEKVWCCPICISKEGLQWIITIMDTQVLDVSSIGEKPSEHPIPEYKEKKKKSKKKVEE